MFTQLQNTLALWLANLGSDERAIEGDEGQTLAEYAMILGLIAVVVARCRGHAPRVGTISSIFSAVASGRHLALKPLQGRTIDRPHMLQVFISTLHVFNSTTGDNPQKGTQT